MNFMFTKEEETHVQRLGGVSVCAAGQAGVFGGCTPKRTTLSNDSRPITALWSEQGVTGRPLVVRGCETAPEFY